MPQILSLVRPNVPSLLTASILAFENTPLRVKIHSSALLSILESSLRTKDNTRTIGALLGFKSEGLSEVQIEDLYIIPHEEKDDEVTIDEHTHRNLFQLYKKHSPDVQIVGWFQTLSELDNVASLVHDFFNTLELLRAAVHLTMRSRDAEGNAIVPEIATYVTTPVGLTSVSAAAFNADDASATKLFTPIPHEVTYDQPEALAMGRLLKSVSHEENLVSLSKSYNELVVVEKTLEEASKLLDTNIEFVEKVLSGEIKTDGKVDKIGKFLISNLVLYTLKYEGFEGDFSKFVQDSLMVEYLVSCLRTQVELTGKLGV